MKRLILILIILVLSVTLLEGVTGIKANEDDIFFQVKSDFIRVGTEFTVPVFTASARPGIELLSVNISHASGFSRDFPVKRTLPGIGDKINPIKRIFELKELKPEELELIRLLAYIPVRIDLKELNPDIRVGDAVSYKVTALFQRGSQQFNRTTEGTAYLLASLPGITGYHPGDTHLHTSEYGDDRYNAIETIIDNAILKGLKYLWFTGHAQKIATSSNYEEYKKKINTEKEGRILATPDLEMSTRKEYKTTTVASLPTSPLGTKITSWTGNSDDDYFTYSLPFTFLFYGVSYSTLYISTNGFVGFQTTEITSPTNVSIPNTNSPNCIIAGYWRDLNPGTATGDGGVYYIYDYGPSTLKTFVRITYRDIPIKGTTNRVTFHIFLINEDRDVQILHPTSPPSGGTAGIEDIRGEYGIGLSLIQSTRFTIDSDSHYLTHNISSYISNPDPEWKTGEDIINTVNNWSFPHSYGTIAHPFHGYPWRYWTKTSGSSQVKVGGFQGIEIISNRKRSFL